MPPYKKQVVTADVPQLKPFDYTRQLDSIASDMEKLSAKTADMAKTSFLNNFELESRKALEESFERNSNNPAQLQAEQQKIQQKFISALPSKEMREEAKLRFAVHAMGYMGKAKQNQYNQELKALQASTLDKANVITNNIRSLGKGLYDTNLSVSGTAANTIGLEIASLESMTAERDAQGNFVLSPEKQAILKDNVRTQLTLADMDFFNGLGTTKEKENFYKAYKAKKTKKIWLDPEDERGYSEQAMTENNTDWPTYERNLATMERTLEVAKQEIAKGMAQEDTGIFATLKVGEMERLDTEVAELEKESKTNPFKVLAFLQEVEDLTKPSHGYQRKDGMRAPFLEPKEAYDYRKDVREKYLSDTIAAIDKPGDKTNFSFGFARIKEFFDQNAKSHGLNDYDRMDMLREYYLQMIHSGIPTGALQDNASVAYNQQVADATQRTISNFVAKSRKFNEHEKNIVLTTPKEIKTHYVAEERPLPGVYGSPWPNMKI